MSTKAAVEALAAALKRRENRFDVLFLGVVVGTASSWGLLECEDGMCYYLYYDFKRDDKATAGNIAVDFETGEYWWFTEDAEGVDINYVSSPMSIIMTALGKL